MNKLQLPTAFARDDTPQGKRQRREQLRAVIERIREAEFPRDYNQFESLADALRKETTEGRRVQDHWRNHVAEKREVPGIRDPALSCPTAIFLPLLQADLAAATGRYWKQLTAGLKSPQRELAYKQPVPAKMHMLLQEAEREEQQALARLRAEVSGVAAMDRLMEALKKAHREKPNPKERLKRAQRRRERKPDMPEIRVWSKPMSQAEYRDATSCSLKTVQRFLRRINAHPKFTGRHAAEPDRYDVAVNLQVLSHWIDSWVREPEQASGLAAATIAYACAYDREFALKLVRALRPALKRRSLVDNNFFTQLAVHHKLYAPVPVRDLSLDLLQMLQPHTPSA